MGPELYRFVANQRRCLYRRGWHLRGNRRCRGRCQQQRDHFRRHFSRWERHEHWGRRGGPDSRACSRNGRGSNNGRRLPRRHRRLSGSVLLYQPSTRLHAVRRSISRAGSSRDLSNSPSDKPEDSMNFFGQGFQLQNMGGTEWFLEMLGHDMIDVQSAHPTCPPRGSGKPAKLSAQFKSSEASLPNCSSLRSTASALALLICAAAFPCAQENGRGLRGSPAVPGFCSSFIDRRCRAAAIVSPWTPGNTLTGCIDAT